MSLVRGRKESKLVRSLVLYVKLGVRYLAAVAARTLNRHIPCIRRSEWVSVRVWVSHPQLQRSCNITCARRKYHCCQRQQYHAHFACISLTLPCGSCSVFEVAHSVYKCALKEFSFGCGCPTRVIPRERSDRGNPAIRRTHQADNLAKLWQEFLFKIKNIKNCDI